MGTNELRIEHRNVRMNLYKIKKYDTINIRFGRMDLTLHENMWIGYDSRYGEYVICAANPCDIQPNDSCIVSNSIVLTFTNENDKSNSLHLCCNSDESAIIFDQKELRWKICIPAVQPEFVKCALRDLFDDARSAWLGVRIGMNSFYGLTGSIIKIPDSTPVPISLTMTPNLIFDDILPEIKDVVFNAPATIVFWEDDTKTVVKAQGENFDPEKGLAMAITKKALGNNGRYYKTIKKWIKKAIASRGKDDRKRGVIFMKETNTNNENVVE